MIPFQTKSKNQQDDDYYKRTASSHVFTMFLFTMSAVAFVFAVITYGLTMKIMSDVLTSTSIATSQFGNGLDLVGIFAGVLVCGILQIISIITVLFLFLCDHDTGILELVLALANLLFIIPAEAIYFKFVDCFNFANNGIVIARSTMAIIYMLIFVLIPIIMIVFFKNSRKNLLKSWLEWVASFFL